MNTNRHEWILAFYRAYTGLCGEYPPHKWLLHWKIPGGLFYCHFEQRFIEEQVRETES